MKMFLASLGSTINMDSLKLLPKMKWNLMSYYYFRSKNKELYNKIINTSELIMVDSGAHSFQKGKKVDWLEYTKEYAAWIKGNDSDHIIGFFEMDADNVLGYEKVLELRKILQKNSDKIIPVWHKGRGVQDYKKMCKEYKGKIVAVSGFRNEDISDHQYEMFLNTAWDNGCRVHCLGMTRIKILNKIPFDYVDSSSWNSPLRYGRYKDNLKVKKGMDFNDRNKVLNIIYREGMKKQSYYEAKWKNYENEYKRGL